MQSEMISKPCQHFSSVCASIDTEVDRILDRLLRGNKPHAYLSSHFLRSLIFKRNDTLCPCRSCHVPLSLHLALLLPLTLLLPWLLTLSVGPFSFCYPSSAHSLPLHLLLPPHPLSLLFHVFHLWTYTCLISGSSTATAVC